MPSYIYLLSDIVTSCVRSLIKLRLLPITTVCTFKTNYLYSTNK